jgi:hypothetical protein
MSERVVRERTPDDLADLLRRHVPDIRTTERLTPNFVERWLYEVGFPYNSLPRETQHEVWAILAEQHEREVWSHNEVTLINRRDRSYQDGQGYGMTRLFIARWNRSGNRTECVERVRVIAHQGNSREYAYAQVDLWADDWTRVVRLNGYELPEGPRYVLWDQPERRGACEDWLYRQSITALEYAAEVLR